MILIDEQWVLNHYKWIVWKIFGIVISYLYLFNDWLSFEKVLDQSKYEYEREINCGYKCKFVIKSIYRRWYFTIMACDSLRVSNIINDISSPLSFSSFSHMLKLGLTDGWHKIDAYIDPPLQQAIMKSKNKK